jgi:hypothetical protein
VVSAAGAAFAARIAGLEPFDESDVERLAFIKGICRAGGGGSGVLDTCVTTAGGPGRDGVEIVRTGTETGGFGGPIIAGFAGRCSERKSEGERIDLKLRVKKSLWLGVVSRRLIRLEIFVSKRHCSRAGR